MKKRFFKFAKMAAQNADYTGCNKNAPAIGAVAVYKGSIVATAWSSSADAAPGADSTAGTAAPAASENDTASVDAGAFQ